MRNWEWYLWTKLNPDLFMKLCSRMRKTSNVNSLLCASEWSCESSCLIDMLKCCEESCLYFFHVTVSPIHTTQAYLFVCWQKTTSSFNYCSTVTFYSNISYLMLSCFLFLCMYSFPALPSTLQFFLQSWYWSIFWCEIFTKWLDPHLGWQFHQYWFSRSKSMIYFFDFLTWTTVWLYWRLFKYVAHSSISKILHV